MKKLILFFASAVILLTLRADDAQVNQERLERIKNQQKNVTQEFENVMQQLKSLPQESLVNLKPRTEELKKQAKALKATLNALQAERERLEARSQPQDQRQPNVSNGLIMPNLKSPRFRDDLVMPTLQ